MNEPVAPVVTGRPPTAGRGRWVVAGLVALIALGGLAVGLVALSGRPVPEVRRWIPADALVVLEARPELPGDQRGHLGNLLAHFPGYRDQSLLDRKLDETFERLVADASGGAVSYARDVKPWLAGPVALAVLGQDRRSGQIGNPRREGLPMGFLLIATTDGTVDGATILGSSTDHLEYRGVPYVTGTVEHAGRSDFVGVVVGGGTVVVGTAGIVTLAIDAHLDGTGIDRDAAYTAALAALDGDRLLTAVARPAALVDLVTDRLPGDAALPSLPANLAAMVPEWVAWGVRAENDALVIDAAASGDGSTGPGDGFLERRPSRLAGRLPGEALAALEVHLADGWLARLNAHLPSEATILAGALGGLVDGVEDVALAALPGETGPRPVLLVGTADAVTAQARGAAIRNLLVLAASSAGEEATTVLHDGIEITVVDLGPALRSAAFPGDPTLRLAYVEPPSIPVALTVEGDTVILGAGLDAVAAVTAVLDVEAGRSLADDPGFRSALERVGATAGAHAWIGLDRVVALVAGRLEGDEAARWQADLAPFAAPLRDLVVAVLPDTREPRIRTILRVE